MEYLICTSLLTVTLMLVTIIWVTIRLMINDWEGRFWCGTGYADTGTGRWVMRVILHQKYILLIYTKTLYPAYAYIIERAKSKYGKQSLVVGLIEILWALMIRAFLIGLGLLFIVMIVILFENYC